MPDFLGFAKFIKWMFTEVERPLPPVKGYTDEQVEEALCHIIGNDWKTILLTEWKNRVNRWEDLFISSTTSTNDVIKLVTNYYFWHNTGRLKIDDILKLGAKLNIGKLDFDDPKVKAVLDQAKKDQLKLAEQIRRNNSSEGLDKEITI